MPGILSPKQSRMQCEIIVFLILFSVPLKHTHDEYSRNAIYDCTSFDTGNNYSINSFNLRLIINPKGNFFFLQLKSNSISEQVVFKFGDSTNEFLSGLRLEPSYGCSV